MSGALIVLVPDETTRKVIEALLERHQSLGVSPIPEGNRQIITDVQRRDPGVYLRAHEFLRSHIQSYRYALVLFDRQGCGAEKRLRRSYDKRSKSGWKETDGKIGVKWSL